jgi:hypothetical protein
LHIDASKPRFSMTKARVRISHDKESPHTDSNARLQRSDAPSLLVLYEMDLGVAAKMRGRLFSGRAKFGVLLLLDAEDLTQGTMT